jgi:hypothetical protein
MEKNIKLKTELQQIKPYGIIENKHINDTEKMKQFLNIYFKNKLSILSYKELIKK